MGSGPTQDGIGTKRVSFNCLQLGVAVYIGHGPQAPFAPIHFRFNSDDLPRCVDLQLRNQAVFPRHKSLNNLNRGWVVRPGESCEIAS